MQLIQEIVARIKKILNCTDINLEHIEADLFFYAISSALSSIACARA
jgi:hypothetical protein